MILVNTGNYVRCKMLNEQLLLLKMYGAINAMEALSGIKERDDYAFALLRAELEYREQKKADNTLKRASFSSDKEWHEIDKSLNPNIDFDEVKALGNGDFIRRKENICILGQQGTGKSHSLVALGRELCRKGFSVKFYTAQALVRILQEAQDSHKLGKMMRSLQKPSLLIIDELGFVPFTESGASLLFEVFSNRYEKGSIAVSSNLSFDKWGTLFKSVELTAALLDRFTHNVHTFVYKGQSVRLLKSKKQKG